MRPLKAKTVPILGIKWEQLSDKIARAYLLLGRFEEILHSVPSPEKVFSILIKEESFHSLRSQHLSISFRKYLVLDSLGKKTKSSRKIENYEDALRHLLRQKKQKISLALILNLHARLCHGTTPYKKEVGKLRKRQNWIGPAGCAIDEAYHLPPPPQDVPKLMQNLIRYWQRTDQEKLVQFAISFAQLLVIHPFTDGNGRVGRMLLPLFLFHKKLLSHPLFFLSRYFFLKRVSYFRKLNEISRENDWEGWISFFLTGVIEEGVRNCKKAEKIHRLFAELKNALQKTGDKKRVEAALLFLFQNPIFEEQKLPSSLLHKLEKQGFVKRIHLEKEKRWIFPPLLQCLKT
ncbi:MAG: Fic family protein [Chlamydiales bacterium]